MRTPEWVRRTVCELVDHNYGKKVRTALSGWTVKRCERCGVPLWERP